ncbi:MAG: glycoside hydrolase N-terminal domain-containing protein [Bacteroidales bacterium]|nr:glycoside hydrolase N-terminal domain-containing protein [Bacteroidales bacterium]
MKKIIALFAFLCLAVGTTSAKGFLKNLGNTLFNKAENTAKIDTKQLEYPIPYIPVDRRSSILPKHNICSIAPATESSDYFITGSGVLRLQASGQPYNEVMTYTHELLYEPKWAETPLPPDLSVYMPRIRQLLLEGKANEVNALLDEAQKKAGFEKYMNFDNSILYPVSGPSRHQAFTLTFRRPEQSNTRDYLRFLDMQNGMITSMWTDARGSFRNESFCAYDGEITVNRFTAPKGQLDLDVTMMLPRLSAGSSHELNIEDGVITLACAYNPEYGQKGYVAVLRFLPQGGTMKKTENGMQISGADGLMVVSKIARFENDFTFECAKPVRDALLAMKIDFDKLLQGNEKYIGERMDRSRIHLCPDQDLLLSGEELLRRAHSVNELDPAMLEKLYDMGRFFQIYETGNKIPPFTGQHNINTNLQVCAGNNTGLFDEMDVYFKYYETKFDDFRTNARLLYGARGLLASVHCDPDSGLYYHFSRTYPHYAWTGCLGWIFNELWGYYLVTGDKEFLRTRVIPGYKEIALFFEDYACDRGPDGKVIFYPSFSPENPTPNPGYQTVTSRDINPTRINSVMDIAICREVLMNLIEGCKTLGIEEENIPHWEAQLADLPTYLLDQDGGLKEWAWPTIEENYNHRHVSHHYDVWPGRAVTPEKDPALTEAIIISNRKRAQQDDSAHGIIHRAFTAIRLKDMEEAMQNLSQLLNHGFVRRTLQTSHFPYRGVFPDLTGAMPAFLVEMSVFSEPGTVEFLPVMPDYLMNGSIDGVWLYTFAKLNHMDWDEKGIRASITSNQDQTLTLRNRREGCRILVNGKELPKEGDHVQYTFKANETAHIEIIL